MNQTKTISGAASRPGGRAFFYYPGGVALLLSILGHASLFGGIKSYGNSRSAGHGRGVYEVDLFSRGGGEGQGVSTPRKVKTAVRPAHRHPVLLASEESEPSAGAADSSGEGRDFGDTGPAGYGEEQVDVPAKLQTPLTLRYPPDAYREGREGDVVLFLVVDPTGRVIRADVTVGAGHGFDEAAVEATRALRFSPAEKDGEAVPVHLHWTCRFRIEG